MANANLPDRWLGDRRFRRDNLPDAAFRAYVTALMYAVLNRTDGVIEPGDLKYIPDFDKSAIKVLIDDGLWVARAAQGTGWFIGDFDTTQSSKDLLESYERKKAWDRDRKAAAAAEKRSGQGNSGGNSGGSPPVESPKPNKAKPNKANTEGDHSADVIALGNHRDGSVTCTRCDGWIARGEAAGPGDNPDWCRDCNDEARADLAGDEP
jgi:hypothetical protein